MERKREIARSIQDMAGLPSHPAGRLIGAENRRAKTGSFLAWSVHFGIQEGAGVGRRAYARGPIWGCVR